ncbi:hypothetical protein BBO99_00002275 [Phytophthora kernoviae]|uniref:Protein kinase domain-containing protein n=2 Tax=Phytophthora kernoviae TaxID=325452 RepID=A0A421GXV3_9STRA|nr:hypothetical protein G195_002693 [Phytophthora kernoviae 00238/432]KAG2528667.1 hypothetical protein JM16_002582 [Phytophthora kernoviae]KAG2530477.1 hypothetical protein JM18_002109 [Phytophthora kernoviae]RLN10671.1 hypothetical protein BBI17_002192 [Phytophthora kernoviae]RLN83270.1 hypothetical protein BBO99_00002275 [Phytophthora kernoviae]
MKEYSLKSLQYEPEDDVKGKVYALIGGESSEGSDDDDQDPLIKLTRAPKTKEPVAIKTPKSTPFTQNDYTANDFDTESESADSDDSDSGVRAKSDSDDSDEPTRTPHVRTGTPSFARVPAAGASTYESNTQGISTSEDSDSMPAGAIVGVVLGVACVLLVLAAFVMMKKRALKKQDSKVKGPLGSSRAIPLAPAGLFGRLNSGHHREDKLADIYTIDGIIDPFAAQSLAVRKTQTKGIWDDPVLVAARIPLHNVLIKELISRGGFGQVFKATYNDETVAVKTLLPDTRKDINEISALFAETKVMAELDHRCIVAFIGVAWDALSTVSCVTEYMPGGDLRSLLNHFEGDGYPRGFDYDKVKIALDIADGLTYLHSLKPAILHRDLKSRNVLLSSQLDAKLTDFGVSREHSDELMTNAVGTSLWMAPEVMMGGRYDCKADVFSFGVLLSEIDTHQMPYANVKNPSGRKPTEAAILQMVAIGTLRVHFSPKCPKAILKLAEACISLDPQDRPSAADVLYKLQIALKPFEEQEITL